MEGCLGERLPGSLRLTLLAAPISQPIAVPSPAAFLFSLCLLPSYKASDYLLLSAVKSGAFQAATEIPPTPAPAVCLLLLPFGGPRAQPREISSLELTWSPITAESVCPSDLSQGTQRTVFSHLWSLTFWERERERERRVRGPGPNHNLSPREMKR